VIDVVVGMHRRLRADHAAGDLDRAVGDHLVGIHVGLGAGAGLEHDQREFAIPFAVDHLLRGGDDQIDLSLRQLTELAVRERRAFLEDADRADHRAIPVEALDSDRKVQVRALSLRAPETIGRHLDVAERILLDAGSRTGVRLVFHDQATFS
jgi:hypothetical protein